MKKPITSLLSMATIALLTSCGGQTAKPVAEETEEPVKMENMETREVSNVSVTWIQDNKEPRTMSAETFGAPEDLVKELGGENGFPATTSCFLVEVDGLHILCDAGNGREDSQLLPSLEKLGLTPEDIEVIFITHMHGDHIGGMMKGETPVFPNAAVYMTQQEHDYWMGMEGDKNERQKKCVEAYKDKLHLIQFGDTVPGGFTALEAIGHTGGHTMFQKDNLVLIGDLMHAAALQVNHPEYNARFDALGDEAIANRKKYLELARQNHWILAGSHLPAPAFMTIE